MTRPPCLNNTGFNLNGTADGFEDDPCSSGTSGSGGSDGTRGRGGGRPRGGGGGRPMPKISCGYCDTSCAYSAIETIFIIGILANIVVLTRVVRDRKLRDPTFVAIAALSLADLLFLVLNLTLSFESVILTITCGTPMILSKPYYLLKAIIWFAANTHVAFLAVLRYVTIAYPIRANVHLTNTKVIIASVVIWVIGSIIFGVFSGMISLGLVTPGRSQEFLIILWIFVYLLPLIVTCVLHGLKILRVKQATKETANEATRASVKRMSKIVIIVIAMAAILPLPRLVNKCMNIVGRDAYPSADFKTHYGRIANIIFLINNTINPFIYGFMSIRFRQSVKDMFSWCRVPGSSEDSAATADTPLSVRKQTFSLETVKGTKSDSVDSFDSVEKD